MQSEKRKLYKKNYDLEHREQQLNHVKNSQNRCRYKLSCDVCNMTFPNQSIHDTHMTCKLHEKNIELQKNPDLFVCCGIDHKRDLNLQIHLKSKLHLVTTNPLIYTCECCSIDHKTPNKLASHIKKQLIIIKPIEALSIEEQKVNHICCGKQYFNKQSYETHLKSKKHNNNITNN